MKCCDDGLVNRGAVRLMKRPQRELVQPSAQQLRTDTAFNMFQFNKMSPQ